MKERRRNLRDSLSSSSSSHPDDNPFDSLSELVEIKKMRRMSKRRPQWFLSEHPRVREKLDPNEFFDWLQTVERVFDFKDFSDEKKVNLLPMNLESMLPLSGLMSWLRGLVRERERLSHVRKWSVNSKKSSFPPITYKLQENFSKLHHLKQCSFNLEYYTREFKQLLIKCDLYEDENQTLVRYLGGLYERIAHVVKLHPYTTLDELVP